MLLGIVGIQLVDTLNREAGAEDGTVDLLQHVPTEVPCHHLRPGESVDGGPGLDRVSRCLKGQNGVFQADLGRRPALDVRVHAVGVVVEDGSFPGIEILQLLLGQTGEAEGPQEQIRVHLAAAEHLGEPPGADVAPEVHLPEPILGMDVALGEKRSCSLLA